MRPDGESADLLVVGSGLAGLATALAAADAGSTVSVLTAGALLSGSSPWAQGGIAAAVGADDRPELHAADTLAVGGGLNDREAVDVLVHAGRTAVLELLDRGVPFDGGRDHPQLGLEAGHQRRRILHADGAATGHAVTAAVLARAVDHPLVQLHDQCPADELISVRGRVAGVRSGARTYTGRAVVLATGGYAALWGRTTNTGASKGTGLALAYHAGATLADLEFVQLHPTAVALPGRPAFLLSEALRGEGALLLDEHDRPVVDPLLPRDVVARAVARHWRDRGPVYLSLRHLDPRAVHARFATIAAQLAEWGLDLAGDPVPVAPAAHYCMGGVRSDSAGRTDVPGLYVAGEVACTGVQGANRLASNSLLECLVFGQRAAEAALADAPERRATWGTTELPGGPGAAREEFPHAGANGAVDGAALDRELGVERSAAGLRALLATLPEPTARGSEGSALVAALAARGALLRTESRGAHFRADAPATEPAWQGRILWQRGREPRFERIA